MPEQKTISQAYIDARCLQLSRSADTETRNRLLAGELKALARRVRAAVPDGYDLIAFVDDATLISGLRMSYERPGETVLGVFCAYGFGKRGFANAVTFQKAAPFRNAALALYDLSVTEPVKYEGRGGSDEVSILSLAQDGVSVVSGSYFFADDRPLKRIEKFLVSAMAEVGALSDLDRHAPRD